MAQRIGFTHEITHARNAGIDAQLVLVTGQSLHYAERRLGEGPLPWVITVDGQRIQVSAPCAGDLETAPPNPDDALFFGGRQAEFLQRMREHGEADAEAVRLFDAGCAAATLADEQERPPLYALVERALREGHAERVM